MKASDIAHKFLVSDDDLAQVCKDLKIGYAGGDSDIPEKDILYIEKRIEHVKEQKVKHNLEVLKQQQADQANKKIKLKRKVHVKGSTDKPEDVKTVPAETAESAGAPVQTHAPKEKTEPRPQGQGGTSGSGERRPYTPRPQGQGGTGGSGERRPYTPRPQGQGGTGGSGERRPYTPRPQGQGGTGGSGERRPYTPRPQGQGGTGGSGERRPYTPRPQGQGGTGGSGRPYTPRPQGQGGPRGGGMTSRPFADRKIFEPKGDSGSKEAESAATKDTSKKRKMGTKEKDRERDKKKTLKNEKADREEKTIYSRRKRPAPRVPEVREAVTPKLIEITENVSVGDLSKKLNVKANEVIARLMKLGLMATINQIIDADTASILANDYGTEVKVVSLYEETVIRDDETEKDGDRALRSPIVTVMGHVDHGKTKLLDAIRKTHVIDQEFGGITQHIGAYRVKVRDQYVTFLDTPGHAAFTTMRARGASVTDIVVLVVAANDGVMPQTIEAINHAKDAKVPIIVAINKIDLPESNPQKVREELTSYDLVPEEWGGTTLFAEISAKQGINIEGLLETILIQAEMLELKANPNIMARGSVIESKIDPGRGPVASILVQDGTLHVGDPLVVGIYSGKVRAMFDDTGKAVQEAGPSTPVEVLGIDGIPSAGDPFRVVSTEKYSKQISQKRMDLKRVESAKKVKKVTLEDLNQMIKEGEVQDVHLIIKADVDGSVQALKDALEKLSTSEVRVKVVHAAAGGINESDVMLAAASNALIIGYHVRPTSRIADIAAKEKVTIKTYNIIFEVTDAVKSAMEGMLAPEIREETTGGGEVRQLFKVSKVGTIAGCMVTSGKILRKNKIRVLREGIVVFDGNLKSLMRYKDEASEVEGGQECGLSFEGFNDVHVGDAFESYRIIEVAKTLG